MYVPALSPAITFALCLLLNCDAPDAGRKSTSSADHHGAVASESAICSRIGIQLLEDGGNAADAMVGTTFCVGVVASYHSGIGGGGFLLVRDQDGGFEFVDFRETAPAAAYKDMYQGNYNGSKYSGLASAVPAEVRGLEYLHKNYGQLPWAHVMAPAIKVARDGFPATADLILRMNQAINGSPDPSHPFIIEDPSWAVDFAPNGELVKIDDIVTRKRYASTLEAIAINGADAFYHGWIAESIVSEIQRLNGTMTLDDMVEYSVGTGKPAQVEYRDYRLTATSAPTSGVPALAALKIIEGYSNTGEDSNRNLSTHRLDEAMKFVYGARTQLGDPAFVSGVEAYERNMLSDEAAAAMRLKITDRAHNVSYYNKAGIESLETPGTSQVVTADGSGLAVTLTSTVNLLFGSLIMVPETGIVLNNEMNDFSIPGKSNAFGYIPMPHNLIEPRKRPLSSVSNVIVEHASNGSLYFVVGAAGGSRIITATIQNLWHVLDHDMTAPEALAQPRMHDQLVPQECLFEYSYDNGTTAFMASRGHNVTWFAPGSSSAQAIRRLANGTFEAAGEPRQMGSGGFAV